VGPLVILAPDLAPVLEVSTEETSPPNVSPGRHDDSGHHLQQEHVLERPACARRGLPERHAGAKHHHRCIPRRREVGAGGEGHGEAALLRPVDELEPLIKGLHGDAVRRRLEVDPLPEAPCFDELLGARPGLAHLN
jgi:hypothetical protein